MPFLETALMVGSLASSVGGAGMSFKQAAEERRLQRNAERAAQEAIDEAKGRTEMNFYEKLAVSMTPYELEQEALLAAATSSMEAAREGVADPSVAAGRIQMAVNQKQAEQRNNQIAEIQRIEQLKAAEDSRLNQQYMDIVKQEAAGATIAAAEAANLRAEAIEGGIKNLTEGMKTGLEAVELYPNLFGNKPVEQVATPNIPKSAQLGVGDPASNLPSSQQIKPSSFPALPPGMTQEEFQNLMSAVLSGMAGGS